VMLTGCHWRIEISFWPVTAAKTTIIQDVYAYKAKTLGERVSQEFFRTRGREIFREDLNTLEAQQEMLTSRAMAEILLSQQEIGLQHHYRVANAMLADAGPHGQ
jgi:phenylpropionate dioxygenase-like ring-hydroxylating dioxygenase large terminal subunit